jgi:hypothetical protein
MKKKYVFFIFVLLFIFSNIFSQEQKATQHIFPTIKELSSKNPIFKQYSQDVENNYKLLAKNGEAVLFFYKYHTNENDTLLSIAARCNISYDTIASLNRIPSIHSDIKNKIIILPTVSGIFIPKNPVSVFERILNCKSFDKSEVICYTVEESDFYFLENEKFDSTERIFFLKDDIISPLPNGILSSKYGLRESPITGKIKFHNGIDLACDLHSPILSCLSGKIEECGYNEVYGNYVVILHDNNIKSFYAHLDSFNCKKNDFVATGQIIGYVGLTGLTTGPHLHFEIYYSGETKDPWKIIN